MWIHRLGACEKGLKMSRVHKPVLLTSSVIRTLRNGSSLFFSANSESKISHRSAGVNPISPSHVRSSITLHKAATISKGSESNNSSSCSVTSAIHTQFYAHTRLLEFLRNILSLCTHYSVSKLFLQSYCLFISLSYLYLYLC